MTGAHDRSGGTSRRSRGALWLLLVAFALLGVLGSRVLSEAFRADAWNAWRAEASRAEQWLSGTVLSWLEESYAPLSGIAVLFENSERVTEDEFLGAVDALEARATAVFIDSTAILRPAADGSWSIQFTTDFGGALSDEAALAEVPSIAETLDVAVSRSGQTVLGRPFVTAQGRTYSPVVLSLEDTGGTLGIVGLMDYHALVDGLFEINELDGVNLFIEGRFPTIKGPGDLFKVYGARDPDTLHESTTRTASAGADLTLAWDFGPGFSGGPDEELATFSFWSGLGATGLITLFLGFLLNQNRTISHRVREATAELEASVARFKVLFGASSDPYLLLDGGRFTDCNQAAVDLLGYSDRAELLSRRPDSLSPKFQPDGQLSSSRGEEVIARAIAGTQQRFDWVHLRKDGGDIPVEVTLTPIAVDERDVLLVVWHDLSERYEAQAALERSERELRKLIEATPFPMAVAYMAEAAPIEFFNQRFIDLFGWTLEDVPNLDVWWTRAFPDPEYRAGLRKEWEGRLEAAARENRNIEPMEARICCKDGSYRIAEWSAAPIGPKSIVMAVDLTERKRMETDLIEAKEGAEQASRTKSTFLANMSHELRTPMNAILGYSEILIEEAEDDGQDDFIPDLKKIHQAGTHLLGLINDVLDLSKVEAGRMETYAEDIDVDALLDQVAGTARPLMATNENQFEIIRDGDLGNARQDMTKLRQSMLNLLSNAAKFTHEGKVTLRATRETRGESDWLVIAVSDSGIGIPADKMETAFEEFGQVEDSTTRNYGGTGLGLPLSRRFCRMLGGDLTVQSELGKGSTFTMEVPVTLPGTARSAASSQSPETGTDEHAEQEAQGGDRGLVLVIDDDPTARDLIGRTLRQDGFSVRTAASGVEGLALARELQPAVITLDVMMPGMDGWSVLRVLKGDAELQDIPVVMLTIVDDKFRGFSLGATDYLNKPVDRDRLKETLRRFGRADESDLVLVVEDDEAARAVISRAAGDAGFQVIEAGNGREALDAMARQTPRLILLDLMMPVMDGFDFLLEMRTHAAWREVPVIVLTAKELDETERALLSGRVETVIEKGPEAPVKVLESVQKLLQEQH